MTVPITNPETGEIRQAEVFVAILPASNYTYAEIQPSQELRYWLGGHVRAFTFFGGVPKTVCPDNLKRGLGWSGQMLFDFIQQEPVMMRADWRAKGKHGVRLVCRKALRHRGYLKDLRGERQWQ